MSGAWQVSVFGVAMSSPTMSQSDTATGQGSSWVHTKGTVIYMVYFKLVNLVYQNFYFYFSFLCVCVCVCVRSRAFEPLMS